MNAIHAMASASVCRFERGLVIDTCDIKWKKSKEAESQLVHSAESRRRGERNRLNEYIILFVWLFPRTIESIESAVDPPHFGTSAAVLVRQ